MSALSVKSQERVSRTLANLLLLALVMYLGVELARVAWLYAWPEQPVPELYGQVAGAQSALQSGGLAPIAGYELFGRSESQAGVADVIRESAPETGLRLRLEGVLIGQRPEDSGAIVAGSNGETEYYRVGDRLPGNAELAEVESARILIRRGGRYESLAFEEVLGVEGIVAETPKDESRPAGSPDEILASARAQLDTQGAAALRAYGLSPASDNGQTGYVYDGSNAMLNAVNLKPGDVITALNGQRLGDFEQDKALFDEWRSQPRLDIEIERNGSLLTVSYAIPEQWRN
ncbi:type II secretion system protein N [Marinobacter sp. AL4B]|uniref:type II secretion system protein N n=1 Tax=Marinobacter sp. AL4B TaxID=2871173 RepID=UPI001CAA5874|nr:type II secretion system protein N [Marinobacter sp. AL4B]MBZ0334023.1 general secretion pathway protein GspC [Marinobacter sp. AL4B]